MPHLVKMQEEFGDRGLAVIGITKARPEAARAFGRDHGARYALLANGAADFDAYGVGAVWVSPVYLVDPEGRIVAEGFEKSERVLRAQLGQRKQ